MASREEPVRYSAGLATRTSRSKGKSTRPAPLRAKDGSQPEVQVSYTAAGQETLAAIAEELMSVVPAKRPTVGEDGPEVSVTETTAGRETLAAIAEETRPGRSEQTTLSYGDRISNAPGAKTPSRVPAPLHRVPRPAPQSSAPEISIGEGVVGRETLAVITAELAPSSSEPHAPMQRAAEPEASAPRAETRAIDEASAEAPFAIFEMSTFVVQGPQIASLSSEALRRRFVEEHLLQRLPAKSMAQVERVDVTPWTVRGTVVVRVWCKV